MRLVRKNLPTDTKENAATPAKTRRQSVMLVVESAVCSSGLIVGAAVVSAPSTADSGVGVPAVSTYRLLKVSVVSVTGVKFGVGLGVVGNVVDAGSGVGVGVAMGAAVGTAVGAGACVGSGVGVARGVGVGAGVGVCSGVDVGVTGVGVGSGLA